MKNLFSGKWKFLTIPASIIIGFLLLPITIGFLLSLLIYKKVGNKKVRYALLTPLVLLTLFFGSAYISAIVSPSKTENNSQNPKTEQTTATQQPEKQNTEVQGASESNPEPTKEERKTYKVTRVIDGDTLEIEGGQRVRFIGVDTPELSGTQECFAREAYDKTKELIEGKEVYLEKDVSETDRYGRLLRYIYLGDEFINETLVKEGYANASTYPPDVKYQDKFRLAEQEARNKNKGLWASCNSATTTKSINSTPTPKPTSTTNSGGSGNTSGSWSCNCSKTCSNITSCAEAQYLLNVCGCSARDADRDGIACDSQCQ